MKPVSMLDYYQTKRCYGASSMDLATLTDFYLPLIGPKGFAAYLALTRDDASAHLHKTLLPCLNLTPGEFEDAIASCEAVGLIRTFVKEDSGANLFVYCLYAPLHAVEFSADIMLSGTLKGKIGVEGFERLFARHQGENAVDDMEEVSVSFPEYFKPSYDATYYLGKPKDRRSLGKATVRTGFDRVSFCRHIEALGLRKNALSDNELDEVEKLATLYSLNEPTMADLAYDCLRINAPIGRKLDVSALANKASAAMPFTYLRKEKGEDSGVKSDTILAQKVRLMDEMPPARYLSILQNGHKPASSDLKLVERLSLQIGLPDPCVNALVEWVLTKNDNVLNAAYCEKIAAAMVREGCRSARDAMDYLTRSGRKKKKKAELEETQRPSEDAATPTKSQPTKAIEQEEVSDEEVQAALDELLKGDRR